MKKLFVCCTDYQLINSLNIKMNIFSEEKADVIILNSKKENQGIAERLKELNIFDNVYLYNKPKSAIRRYFQESERDSIFDACKEDFLYFLRTIKSNFEPKEYLISSNVYGGIIDFSLYNHVFGIATETIVDTCRSLVFEKTYGKCTISSIDEGIYSYKDIAFQGKVRINDVYLYKPNLALYRGDQL